MLSKRQIVVGVGFWGLVFGIFVTVVGVGEFAAKIQAITPSQLALLLATVGAGTIAMGTCFYVISRSLNLGLSYVEAIFLNTSVSLAHNLTPFGQAGGEPIAAAIVSQRSGRPYEECLAALSMKDIVSFVPAILVFVFGGAYLVVFGHSVPDRLRPLVAGFTIMVALGLLAFTAIRTYPDKTRSVLHFLVGGLNRIVGRLPFLSSIDESEIENRVHNFADSLGDVATDKKTVILSSGFATLAFILQGCLLWIALSMISGVDISVVLAVFILQVSLLASGLPLPGGSGGVESAQVLMIVAMTDAATAPTITAVVLSRGLVFWTPIVLGSLTLTTIQAQVVAE